MRKLWYQLTSNKLFAWGREWYKIDEKQSCHYRNGAVSSQSSWWYPYCLWIILNFHYNDVIMSAMASQITGVSIVCSIIGSGTDKRKHKSSATLAFLWGIHLWPVNSPHKWPVTRKMFPFDDIIMLPPHSGAFIGQYTFRNFFSSDGFNYALSRAAYQSSVHYGNTASRAVDGDEATSSHTSHDDYKPWWKVELAYPIRVTHVAITNRHANGK